VEKRTKNFFVAWQTWGGWTGDVPERVKGSCAEGKSAERGGGYRKKRRPCRLVSRLPQKVTRTKGGQVLARQFEGKNELVLEKKHRGRWSGGLGSDFGGGEGDGLQRRARDPCGLGGRCVRG